MDSSGVLDTIQTNRLPIANAGINQTVYGGDTVTLDGSASGDADSDPLSYIWVAPSVVTLTRGNTDTPTFEAPSVSTTTQYTFTLIVNDGALNSDPVTVTITVKPALETTSPDDLPFTTADFGSDANRLAKWRHALEGIEIEIHYRSEETPTRYNQAIRKMVINSAGSAEIDLVNTPDWNLFNVAQQLDRAYHVGTDGSTMVASGASDLFSIAANDGSAWVIDVAQQANNRGRLALGNGFSASGVWEFISDESLQVQEPFPVHSIQTIKRYGSDSEIMLGVLGFDSLTLTDGGFDIEENIITLDVKADLGSAAEGYLFQGRRWKIVSLDEDSQGGNRYSMHLETEDGNSHGLSQSVGVLDVGQGLQASSTWVDTGDRKASEDGDTDGGDSGTQIVINKELTAVTAPVGGNAAFKIRASGAGAIRWAKDIHGQRQDVTGEQVLSLDWVEFPFYEVNASQAVNVQVKASRLVKGVTPIT